MQKVVDDIRYEAQQHYAGQRLDQITRILSVHAREQAEPGTEREVAGGIENLNFAKVEVKGDSATVSLSVRKWLDYLHFDVEGRPHLVKPPHLLLNYTFGLTRSDAGWRIVAEDFKFASGAV